MKTKWILLLGCVMLTACGQPDAVTDAPPVEPDKVANSDITTDTENGENTAPVEAPAESTEAELPAAASLADRISAVKKVQSAEMKSFRAISTKQRAAFMAADAEGKEKIQNEMMKLQDVMQSKIDGAIAGVMDKIKEAPTSDDAMNGLTFVLETSQDDDLKSQAFTVLKEHHLDSPKVSEICELVVRTHTADTESFLKGLVENSPHESVQAAASLATVRFYQGVIQHQETAKQYPEMKASEFVTSFDPSSFDAEAMMDSFVEKYGDLKSGRQTYAEIVEPELYILKNLSVGKVAPEINGIDLDDEEFKLSDYRGKVILLDFWGDW